MEKPAERSTPRAAASRMMNPLARSVASVAGSFCIALLAADISMSAATAQAQLPPFLEMRVPKPPTIGTGERGSFLTYEVQVTNFTPVPFTIKKLEVMSAAADKPVLFSSSDSALIQAVSRPGMAPAGGAERLKVAGGTRAVVFMWVPVEPRAAPTSISTA